MCPKPPNSQYIYDFENHNRQQNERPVTFLSNQLNSSYKEKHVKHRTDRRHPIEHDIKLCKVSFLSDFFQFDRIIYNECQLVVPKSDNGEYDRGETHSHECALRYFLGATFAHFYSRYSSAAFFHNTLSRASAGTPLKQ